MITGPIKTPKAQVDIKAKAREKFMLSDGFKTQTPEIQKNIEEQKKLKKLLSKLDKQDGVEDGVIAHSVWSNYEEVFEIKSSSVERYYVNSKGEKDYIEIYGVDVNVAWLKIIIKNPFKYGKIDT